MERFGYDLRREGYEVIFQVIEMDESLRGKGELFKYGEVRIASVDCPEMPRNVIYLRGLETSRDKDTVRERFPTLQGAKEYYEKTKQALEAFKLSLIKEEGEEKKEDAKSRKDLIDTIRDVVSDVEVSIFSDGSYSINLWEVGVPITLNDNRFCLDCELYDEVITNNMLDDISKVINILEEYRKGGYCKWL